MMVVNIGWASKAGSFLIAEAPMQRRVPMPLEREMAMNIVAETKPEKVNACWANSFACSPVKANPFQTV